MATVSKMLTFNTSIFDMEMIIYANLSILPLNKTNKTINRLFPLEMDSALTYHIGY